MISPNLNIKRKLLISLYLYPLLIRVLVLIAKFSFWPSVNWFIVPAILGSILIVSLIVQRRYIVDLQVNAEKIQVTYFTPLLVKSIWDIDLQQVTDIKIYKTVLGEYGELDIITNGKWHSFDIYSNSMAKDIHNKINCAYINFTHKSVK
jgi:hypothetical protein